MRRQSFFTLLVFTLGLFALTANPPSFASGPQAEQAPEKKQVVVVRQAGPARIALPDLADGESKTIQEGDKTIVITRKGDSITATVNGKEVGGENKVMIIKRDGKPGDGDILMMSPDQHMKVSAKQVIVMKDDEPDGTGRTMRLETAPDNSEVGFTDNGVNSVIKLNDLADGEVRTLATGKHTIAVVRKGNQLIPQIDGKNMVPHDMFNIRVAAPGEKGQWTADGEKGERQVHAVIVRQNGDAAADKNAVQVFMSDKNDALVTVDGQTNTYKLQDFADGETRTFTASGHSVTITRKGESFNIAVDGKELPRMH